MHTNEGWYLEFPPEHYRADKCFDNVTKATRISDTDTCLNENITNLRLTHVDLLGKAVGDLSNRLNGLSNVQKEASFRDL